MIDIENPPAPGSAEAIALNCQCPEEHNNRGVKPPFADGTWWVDEGCTVHETWFRETAGSVERRAKRGI